MLVVSPHYKFRIRGMAKARCMLDSEIGCSQCKLTWSYTECVDTVTAKLFYEEPRNSEINVRQTLPSWRLLQQLLELADLEIQLLEMKKHLDMLLQIRSHQSRGCQGYPFTPWAAKCQHD